MGDRHENTKLSRRAIVAGAGVFLAAGALPRTEARAAEQQAEGKAVVPNAIPPSEALERLKAGNARYMSGASQNGDFSVGRVAGVGARFPIAGVLACAECPAPAEIVFDQAPGDLFVSSNAGNVVSSYELASFEFAVTSFKIPLIFVMGLTNCAAVLTALGATVRRKELPGNLPALVKAMEPAVISAHGRHASDPVAETVKENVRLGMKRLKTQSTIIGEAVMAGKLKIAGGVYDPETGAVNLV